MHAQIKRIFISLADTEACGQSIWELQFTARPVPNYGAIIVDRGAFFTGEAVRFFSVIISRGLWARSAVKE